MINNNVSADYYVYLFANFDLTPFNDPESFYINGARDNLVLNSVPATQTLTITEVPLLSTCNLTITSNGIDNIETFAIDKNKFTNTDIYFTIRVQTATNSHIKQIPAITPDLLTLTLIGTDGLPISGTRFTTNNNPISGTAGGTFRGILNCSLTAKDVKIHAVYNAYVFNLTGNSSVFDVYPSSGAYDIRKVNEDHDQHSTFKNLAFQDALKDKNTLFDAFLGQIVGDSTSSPDTIGIKTYEKISNFVSNNADIVYANLPAFISMLDSLDINYENYQLSFPPSMARLVDIFSVPLVQQIGSRNKFMGNFNDRGYINSQLYGKNKGSALPISSTVLYANFVQGKNILAHEKFSDSYKIVTSFIINSSNVTYRDSLLKSYELSGYNSFWGWGLVLPPGLSGVAVKDYYDFYEFNNVTEDSLIQKFIDFDNTNNTYLVNCSSYKDYSGNGGIMDNILTYNLYTNVGIIST